MLDVHSWWFFIVQDGHQPVFLLNIELLAIHGSELAFLGLLHSNIRIPFIPTGDTMVPFHFSKVTSRLVEFAGLNPAILSSSAIFGTLSHMDWA